MEPWQLNLKEAEKEIDDVFSGDKAKLKSDVEHYTKKIEEIYEDKSLSKIQKKIRLNKYTAFIVKLKEKIVIADWAIERAKIFILHDSIYAIKVVEQTQPKKKFNEILNYEYEAVVKTPSGQGYTTKLVSAESVQDNIKEEFKDQLLSQHNEKGWVVFG